MRELLNPRRLGPRAVLKCERDFPEFGGLWLSVSGEQALDGGDQGRAACADGGVRGQLGCGGADLRLACPGGGDLVDQGEHVDRIPGGIDQAGALGVAELFDLAGDGGQHGVGRVAVGFAVGEFEAAPSEEPIVVRVGREVVEEDARVAGQVRRVHAGGLDERGRFVPDDVVVQGLLAAEVGVDPFLAGPRLLGEAVHSGAA